MVKWFGCLAIPAMMLGWPAHSAPMLYSFSGNSGVIVDELGLVANAGLFPTGNVSYQFVVDLEESTGTAEDRRFFANLISKPYLFPEPSEDDFDRTGGGQSYNSSSLLAGNIGVQFNGLSSTPVYGDSYNVGVGVSSFDDLSVLLENWTVGGYYGGGETYRAANGSRSSFTSYLRLDSIEPYRVTEPQTLGIFLAGLSLIGVIARRKKPS